MVDKEKEIKKGWKEIIKLRRKSIYKKMKLARKEYLKKPEIKEKMQIAKYKAKNKRKAYMKKLREERGKKTTSIGKRRMFYRRRY